MRAENLILRNITILYAFYSKFTTLGEFKKVQDFSGKPICFFSKKQTFKLFGNFYYFTRILRHILLPLAIFKKLIFFQRTHLFFERNPEC